MECAACPCNTRDAPGVPAQSAKRARHPTSPISHPVIALQPLPHPSQQGFGVGFDLGPKPGGRSIRIGGPGAGWRRINTLTHENTQNPKLLENKKILKKFRKSRLRTQIERIPRNRLTMLPLLAFFPFPPSAGRTRTFNRSGGAWGFQVRVRLRIVWRGGFGHPARPTDREEGRNPPSFS